MITPADIERWTGAASFQKGQAYFRQGKLLRPRRQGRTLKAQCLGSSAPSYQLEARLNSKGIASADCSCPVGAGGHCKHLAALLLAWLEDPGSFQEIEDLAASLKRRSKADLIALIRRMLQQDPELEFLLEFSLPDANGSRRPVDANTITRQAQHAFRASEGDWCNPSQIARELDPLCKLGQSLTGEQPAEAALVFRALAETILEHENVLLSDADARLARVLDACAEGLGGCLEQVQEASLRESLLHRLLDIYAWNAQMGGVGIGEAVPEMLSKAVLPEERGMLCGWIRAALPRSGDWGRKALGRLLEELGQQGANE